MAKVFSNPAGKRLLASVQQVFKEKNVFYRRDRFIVFVCGGPLGEGQDSLRQQFVQWAASHLPDFVV